MRLLPWLLPLLPATNLVAASHFKQRQVSSLVGVEITILALLNDDLPQAVELDGVVSVDLSGSSDLATASPFILQDRTGYLYTSQPGSEVFSSGYAILVVPSLTSTDGMYVSCPFSLDLSFFLFFFLFFLFSPLWWWLAESNPEAKLSTAWKSQCPSPLPPKQPINDFYLSPWP